MGASASKPARSAAAAASRRQYPRSPSPGTTSAAPRPSQQQQQHQQQQQQATPTREAEAGPTYHSKQDVSSSRTQAIDLDAHDPHFAASLRSLGAVTPNPTMSNSSTFRQTRPSVFPDADSNPALLVVTSRARLTKAAEQEQESFGRPSHPGREFLDALTIRQILSMRDRQQLASSEIERLLRLSTGVVDRLGAKGIVGEPA